jgi:2,3,4,5-tetrahydropyridine-2-carboxylate N-succinyltransferase
MYGEVPPYSVVVAGSMPSSITTMSNGMPAPHLYCAVIVKRVDEQTRSKTGINELLRD